MLYLEFLMRKFLRYKYQTVLCDCKILVKEQHLTEKIQYLNEQKAMHFVLNKV